MEPRRGFTLIEMVSSLAAGCVLLLALGSALVIAAGALPPRNSAGDPTLHATIAADQLLADAQVADSVMLASAGRIILRVPDRTGDALPDLVEYHWPGPPGSDLVRRVNGGAWGVVMPRVAEFELIYDTSLQTTQTTQVQRQIIEPAPLVSFSGWSGVPSTTAWTAINANDWAAQTIALTYSLPPGMSADSVTINEVRLRLRGSGLVTVSVHRPSTASPTLPDAMALGTVSLPLVITDPNGSVVTFPLSGVRLSGAPPSIVVLVRGDATSTASLRFLRAASAPDVGHFLRRTSNAGGAWTAASPNEDAWFLVDGSYAVIGAVTTTLSATHLRGLSVQVRSADGSVPVRAGIATPNRPVMP